MEKDLLLTRSMPMREHDHLCTTQCGWRICRKAEKLYQSLSLHKWIPALEGYWFHRCRQCWYEFYKWSTQHVWHNFTYHVNKTKIERDSNLLENLSCIHLTCYVCFSIYLGAYILSQWGAYSFYVSAFLSYSRHSRPLLRAKDDAANQEYVHHKPWSLADWRAMLRDKMALIVRMV